MSGRRVASRASGDRAAGSVLRVDPIACEGIGMCAHLAPGVIGLDPWGFPVLPERPLTGRDLRAGRAAAAGCPRRALFLKVSATTRR